MTADKNTTDTTQRPKRRWFRYSLQTLLLIITALCVWLGFKVEAARKQREAVAALQKLCSGVTIKYDYEPLLSSLVAPPQSPEPHWLVKYVGIDFLHDVTALYAHPGLQPNPPADVRAIFPILAEFRHLRLLNIIGGTFQDDDFRHLANTRDLEILFLNQNSISGEGLRHLSELKKLRQLILVSNPITDQGIEAAANLTNLQELQIGIGHGGPRESEELARITDRCIESLVKVSNLKRMHFEETNISADAVARLQKALPNCSIFYDNYAAERWTKLEHVLNAPAGAAARDSTEGGLPGSRN
jgi:hypothetical protein